MRELTAARIKSVSTPGRYGDGGTLRGSPKIEPRRRRFLADLDLPPKLVQLLCDFSGLVSLAHKGPRRQIPERRVRPSGVVVLSPIFDPVSGVVQR